MLRRRLLRVVAERLPEVEEMVWDASERACREPGSRLAPPDRSLRASGGNVLGELPLR